MEHPACVLSRGSPRPHLPATEYLIPLLLLLLLLLLHVHAGRLHDTVEEGIGGGTALLGGGGTLQQV